MGAGAIIAVVLIIICAIVVMVAIIKQASPKDKHGGTGMSYGYYPPPPDAYPPAPAPTQNQAEYVNQGPPQINIYMKRPAGSMWRCPKCDGENECYAAQCQICGQLLR